MINQEQKQKIVIELGKRLPKMVCPMCSHKKFVLVEGYFNNNLQQDFDSFSIGGSSIPSIAIICENCGFVSQHALGVLGLLPKENIKKNEP